MSAKKVYEIISKSILTKKGIKKIGDTIEAGDIHKDKLALFLKEGVIIGESEAKKAKAEAEKAKKDASASMAEVKKLKEAVDKAQADLLKDKEEFEAAKEAFKKEVEEFKKSSK